MDFIAWEYQSVDVEDIISDHKDTLETWVPEDPFDVAISLSIHIGPASSTTRELFETAIYTTSQAERRSKKHGDEIALELEHAIIVERFDWPQIKSKLDETIIGCQRLTWPDTLLQLRKHFPWMYEGC